MRIAVLTISDQGARGERPDRSGPRVRDLVKSLATAEILTEILPDDRAAIEQRLIELSQPPVFDLVLTTGGTGVSPRDVTPEATRAVVDREIPGLGEAMRRAGLAHTPFAMISRGIAGLRGATLIVNLPGSPDGAAQSLEAVLPAIPHIVAKAGGDPRPCAGPA